MIITSPDFKNNGRIPVQFTEDGENINPELEIRDIPENAKSLVLIVDDPDAPAGVWVHWIVFNIDPKTQKIFKNSIPDNGLQGQNSFRIDDYSGPSPPSGTHRYFFKIFALDTKISLNEGASLEEIERAIESHILCKAELIGLYSR